MKGKTRLCPWPVDDAGCGLRSVSCISNSHLFGLIVCIEEILESRVAHEQHACNAPLCQAEIRFYVFRCAFLSLSIGSSAAEEVQSPFRKQLKVNVLLIARCIAVSLRFLRAQQKLSKS